MSPTGFRFLVAAYVVSLVVLGVAGVLLPPPVSEQLAELYDQESMTFLHHQDTAVLAAVAAVIMAAIIAALVGLYRLRRWGLWLAALLTLAELIALPFFGPFLSSGLDVSLDAIVAGLWGAILVSAFTPPLRQAFR
ncbi:hypothetical protein [Reyranella sp. CPCC 100927]|uniref:hypothetical protein n=1 Tax=Reyranella sp. CPCC 100927 TaxID=2599616 RepID=UPI0011B40491|nr:hypothetical protein [Reyranella sp. CPCC 100927]TWS94699.1 hypothetical protein FQU96_40965 [Reyranella sp. CPCC 100927]